MDRDLFLNDLKELLQRHSLWLSGRMRIREIGDWDKNTAECEIVDTVSYGYAEDCGGPFLSCAIQAIPEYNNFNPKSSKVTLVDRDKLLADGVLSPLDQQTYFTNRRKWGEHLKENGCVEIGNDFNNSANKKKEIVGDFDCRKELAQATDEVMEKYGN